MEETTVQSLLPEVVRELSSFSPERIAEVYDFVLFLKTRPEPVVDARNDWSEEDLRDVTRASLLKLPDE